MWMNAAANRSSHPPDKSCLEPGTRACHVEGSPSGDDMMRRMHADLHISDMRCISYAPLRTKAHWMRRVFDGHGSWERVCRVQVSFSQCGWRELSPRVQAPKPAAGVCACESMVGEVGSGPSFGSDQMEYLVPEYLLASFSAVQETAVIADDVKKQVDNSKAISNTLNDAQSKQGSRCQAQAGCQLIQPTAAPKPPASRDFAPTITVPSPASAQLEVGKATSSRRRIDSNIEGL